MKLWIDCEYNGFGGELISLALVAESGEEFYEVLYCAEPTKWVAEHVMTILGQMPIPRVEFQNRLSAFLAKFDTVHIIADWPEDIRHFCDSLLTGPGMRLNTPALTMEVVRIDGFSELPHNALADARGLREMYMRHM